MRRFAVIWGTVLFSGCFGSEMDHAVQKRTPDPPQTPPAPADTAPREPAAVPKEPPETETSAPLPAVPRRPTPLTVEGFHPASHVGPEDASRPRPVTVVLHGNYDRPEWQCETWQRVASFRGWVLCPRGTPTPWADPADNRWHYAGQKAVAKEIDAAIGALESRYGGLVSREETVLVGFSLGAIYAAPLIISRPGMFSYLFLVEGGVDRLERWHLRALQRAGVKGIGMAMSSPRYRKVIKPLTRKIEKQNMTSVFVDMRGAGHDYRSDFTETGRRALAELLGTAE